MEPGSSSALDAANENLYLLTIDQVAERLGVHHQTVRGYIAKGELHYVELGGTRFVQKRVSLAQLADFIESRTINAVD